jgi:hypothetical protein
MAHVGAAEGCDLLILSVSLRAPLCYRTPQRGAKPHSVTAIPSAQKALRKNFISLAALALPVFQSISAFFLNTHPASWPLDCIFLYVQVKTYA